MERDMGREGYTHGDPKLTNLEGLYGKPEIPENEIRKTPENKEKPNLHDVEVELTGTDSEITKEIKQIEESSGEYTTSVLTIKENTETGENAVIAFFQRRDLECG